MELHPVLRRQLANNGASTIEALKDPILLKKVLQLISDYYYEVDKTRYMMERSAEMSTNEMEILYKELAERREKLQALISEGLCFIDASWKIESMNSKCEDLLGIESKSAVGKHITNIVNLYPNKNNKTPFSEQELKRHLENSQPFTQNDAYIMGQKHTTLAASYSINPIIREGEFSGAVIVLRETKA